MFMGLSTIQCDKKAKQKTVQSTNRTRSNLGMASTELDGHVFCFWDGNRTERQSSPLSLFHSAIKHADSAPIIIYHQTGFDAESLEILWKLCSFLNEFYF